MQPKPHTAGHVHTSETIAGVKMRLMPYRNTVEAPSISTMNTMTPYDLDTPPQSVV